MYEMLIRKKALKIQERLGMRIGIAYGTSKIPLVRTPNDVLTVLRELYKIGMKAFVLPPNLFSGIKTTSDLYKTYYGNLLKIKDIANKSNIELSIHTSTFPDDPSELDEMLKTFSNIASIMDCRTFAIHPTFYKMMPQDQALKLVVYKINEILGAARTDIKMGVETTGRTNEVGSLEDVIDIVKRTKSTEPVINWAHIHARGSGALRTQEDFRRIIEKITSNIGTAWLQNAYFFFSGVSYGPSGEIKHIPLDRSDINLEYLIREIMASNIKGTLIFEDPGRDKFMLDMLDRLADMVR
jgi:deoxyribonuclease-4